MDNIFSFFSVFPFCTPLRMTALAVIKVRVQPSSSLQKRGGSVSSPPCFVLRLTGRSSLCLRSRLWRKHKFYCKEDIDALFDGNHITPPLIHQYEE